MAFRPDRFARAAVREGLPSRAAFKLREIQSKFRILRPGHHVLDLGASPGSWTLEASRRVGARGSVLALDLQPLRSEVASKLPRNVRFRQQDILQWRPERDLLGRFHVLLSDMAPRTTGDKDSDADESLRLAYRSWLLSTRLVRRGGALVVKVFQRDPDGFGQLLRECESTFATTRVVKPESSKKRSVECFVVCLRKKD